MPDADGLDQGDGPGRRASLPIGKVAKLAGVTVRTLHHYDRIGLLRPAGRSAAGYREYQHSDLRRLQHILAYRELGFGLGQIGRMLDDAGTGAGQLLRRQLSAVLARIGGLQQIAAVLERTMEAQKMGINLPPDEMLDVFGGDHPGQYADETRQRWGETGSYQQSRGRTASYTKGDWLRVKAEQQAVTDRMAVLFTAGLAADSEQAREAAEAHRQHISSAFYDCTYQIHAGLADMYLADSRFTTYYEERTPGLARWVHDAIHANASAHGQR